MTAVNDVLVTITVLLVVDAFVYLLAGIVVGVSPVGRWTSLGVFVALTLVLGWVTLVAYRMDHVGDVEDDGPMFEGVRISKGASRTASRVALWGMLHAPDEDDPDDER